MKNTVCVVWSCVKLRRVSNVAHACVCVCVCRSGWVCVHANVGGAQRPHCDPPLSLKALESGTLSRSETQTIYNSRLVLILSEISISCGRPTPPPAPPPLFGGSGGDFGEAFGDGKASLCAQCELKDLLPWRSAPALPPRRGFSPGSDLRR